MIKLKGILFLTLLSFLIIQASAAEDISTENWKEFENPLEECEGDCTTDLNTEISEESIKISSGSKGYCGEAGVRKGIQLSENAKIIKYKLNGERGAYGDTMGVKINGDYKSKLIDNGQINDPTEWNQVTRTIDVSDYAGEEITLGFQIGDKSKNNCNNFDHFTEMEVYDMEIKTTESDMTKIPAKEWKEYEKPFGDCDGYCVQNLDTEYSDDKVVISTSKTGYCGVAGVKNQLKIDENDDKLKLTLSGLRDAYGDTMGVKVNDKYVKKLIEDGRPEDKRRIAQENLEIDLSKYRGEKIDISFQVEDKSKDSCMNSDHSLRMIVSNIKKIENEEEKEKKGKLKISRFKIPKEIGLNKKEKLSIEIDNSKDTKFEGVLELDFALLENSNTYEPFYQEDIEVKSDKSKEIKVAFSEIISEEREIPNNTKYSAKALVLLNKTEAEDQSSDSKTYHYERLDKSEDREIKLVNYSKNIGEINYRLTLHRGWNMISLPKLELNNGEKIKGVYTTDLEKECDIESYDGKKFWTIKGDEWHEPELLESSEAVMVNADQKCVAELNPETSPTIESSDPKKLLKGVNMISVSEPKSLEEYRGSCKFEELAGSKIWHYKGENRWIKPDTDQKLKPERGYYVKAKSKCNLGGSGQAPPTPTGKFFDMASKLVK